MTLHSLEQYYNCSIATQESLVEKKTDIFIRNLDTGLENSYELSQCDCLSKDIYDTTIHQICKKAMSDLDLKKRRHD